MSGDAFTKMQESVDDMRALGSPSAADALQKVVVALAEINERLRRIEEQPAVAYPPLPAAPRPS
jgi:hypothetical protein